MPGDEATPATAVATPEPAAPVTTVNGPDGKPFDPARALAAIERLKGEAGKVGTLEQQLIEAQTKLKEHEDAKLSDTEKLTNRNTELEASNIALEHRVQELTIGQSVRDAAAKAGAKYPDAVFKLVDLATVEFDKDGTPKNLDKIVEGISKSYPDMFNGTNGPGRVAAGPRTPTSGRDFNQMIRESAGRG